VAFPLVAFAPGFEDVFEPDRDLFDDGAETAPGVEIPPWRVFFRKGGRTGLIVAARSKLAMSRFQIMANGFHIRPHSMVCCDTLNLNPAMTLTPRPQGRVAKDCRRQDRDASSEQAADRCEAAFEIGPWRREGHKNILRAARLTTPAPVPAPPAKGAPARGLKGRVFHAADFARPSAASKTFSRRRWLAAPMPWAQKGVALIAATGVRPPALRLDPRLSGVYRVFVGVANGAGVQARLTGNRHFTVRMAALPAPPPNAPNQPGRHYDRPCSSPTFMLCLSGQHRPAEVEIGVARMDGKQIEIKRLDSQDRPCVVDYIRFEPLSPRQAAAWEKNTAAAPRVPLSGMADIPDNAWFLEAQDPDPDLMAANVASHAECGVRRILWRIDGQCSDYPSRVNTMRYPCAKVHGVFCPQSLAYGRLLKKVDILDLFVRAAKREGVEPWGWMRFNNYSGNVASDFFRSHPEFRDEKEAGVPAPSLCLAFEEVRRHKLDILLEAAAYGLAGLNLGFLRHPPVLLYHPRLVDAYTREYGQPPPRDRAPQDPGRNASLPPDSPEWQRWYAFRARYLTLFGRELRQGLNERGMTGVKISIWVRPNHCLFDGIDLDTWLSEGLCDEVICGPVVAAHEQAHPELYRASPEWMASVRQRVPLKRSVFWAGDERAAVAEAKHLIAEGYDGLCLYESNWVVLDTPSIRACRRL